MAQRFIRPAARNQRQENGGSTIRPTNMKAGGSAAAGPAYRIARNGEKLFWIAPDLGPQPFRVLKGQQLVWTE